MATTAPQWLLPAYVRSVTALGATASMEHVEESGRDLIEKWSSPNRRFHDIAHLVAVLQRVDELAEETHHPELVRVAAWYHGAIFDSAVHKTYHRAVGENKDASASHALARLQELGVPHQQAERVSALIRGLIRHDSDPTDVDAMVLCDSDMGILASEPQKYRDYRIRVRAEFDHVPPLEYLDARISIVTSLLARRRLFLSPLAEGWETAGRQNLTAELSRLKKERGVLVGGGAAPDAPAVVSTSTVPVRRPLSNRGESAELVGVAFEDQPKVARSAGTQWGIERAPESARDIPRRVEILHRPVASPESAASPADGRRGALLSTSDSADESTCSLFKPFKDA